MMSTARQVDIWSTVRLAPSLLLPILTSWESMEKHLGADGDFSHVLPTYHIAPGAEGSSLPGPMFLLLP